MKVTALIMAGGKGERFWPKSRQNCPKQFIDITNSGKTMIQLTVHRILPLINIEDIYIVTNSQYKDIVQTQLPQINHNNIICEPAGRNTAPCIGLGAAYILKKEEDAMVVVLSSDHTIKYEDIFRKTLKQAIHVAAEKLNIVTIGIAPNIPETGYGYIKQGSLSNGSANVVEYFVEKPDKKTALEYLKDGNYLWNSGMFVWKASTIMALLQLYLPNIYAGLRDIQEAIGTNQEEQILNEIFLKFPSESIDTGVIEKTDNLYVLRGEFGWDDVGSWRAIERSVDGDEQNNIAIGNVELVDTTDCIIISHEKKLVATVGLNDVVVVDTEDVTLIGNKDSMERIKTILQLLKDKGKKEYL